MNMPPVNKPGLQNPQNSPAANPPSDDPQGMEFVVMPSVQKTAAINEAKTIIEPPATPLQGSTPPPPDIPVPSSSHPFPWKTISLITAGVAVLAVGGYFAYLQFSKKTEQSKQEPNILVPSAANSEKADTDNDGLADSEEKKKGTKSNDPDTDADGLADGDEIFVYGTDPLLSDTDNDTFPDGQEPAAGYSPTKNTSDKAAAKEIQTWTENIARHGLHEPTKTTLGIKSNSSANNPEASLKYTNSVYKYSVEVPSDLAYRENQDKSQIGIYVKQTTLDDDDISSDPIVISIAVKSSDQTLRSWAEEQFELGTYDLLREQKTSGGTNGLIMGGLRVDEQCNSSKAFFNQSNTIIILTRTSCGPDEAMAIVYSQIVDSFIFTQ